MAAIAVPICMHHATPDEVWRHPKSLVTTKIRNRRCEALSITKFRAPTPQKSMRVVVNCSPESPQQQAESEATAGNALEKRGESEDLGIESVGKAKNEKIEVGWKRTKLIVLERPKGAVVADFLGKLEFLLDRPFGSGSADTLASVGGIVVEKVKEEIDVIRAKDEVPEHKINELVRVVRLLEVDLRFVRSARKEETLCQRLEQAQMHCKQAILVANAL
eukprot:Gb_15735 [translate_table: standard]